MMTETGRFEKVPQGVVNLAEPARERAPRPTLAVGEIVSVKGVDFVVTRIKADGNLGLRMVARGGAISGEAAATVGAQIGSASCVEPA